MRFIAVLNSFTGIGLVVFFLEMARYIATDPVEHHMAVFDWHVPLVLALASSVLAYFFIRELVLDLRGYYR